MKDKGLVSRLEGELEELRHKVQLRSLATLRGINLCSNDYLGLSDDPRLKEAVALAVSRTKRVSSTGSRLLSGNATEWEEVERVFADFAGTEAALYFSSGYAANVGLLSAVLKPGDFVFSDASNHASLIDGMRLSGANKIIYPHADCTALAHALEQHRDSNGARVIVSESTFSMEGDAPPIEELLALARRYEAEVILDEAHATGVFGPEGRGRAAHTGRERECLAIVHTCGKALASMGAFVCGSETLKQYLVNRARTFIYSTAPPPYVAGQIRAALKIVRAADDERAHLLDLSQDLRARLKSTGFDTRDGDSPIVPLMVGENEMSLAYAGYLQERGFAVRAIRSPTVPDGTSRLRLSLTSRLTKQDMRRLTEALEAARESVRRGTPLTADA